MYFRETSGQQIVQQYQPEAVAHPGYYTATQHQTSKEKEDIGEVYEHSKELERVAYLRGDLSDQGYLNKAVYSGGHTGSTLDLERKGCISIDNVTIADKYKHKEFIDFLNILMQSKHLLFSTQELTKTEEKRKRTLLALLCNLNWRVKDCFLQARLIKSMDERLQMLKAFVEIEHQ